MVYVSISNYGALVRENLVENVKVVKHRKTKIKRKTNHSTKNNAVDFGGTLTIQVEEMKKLSLKVDLLLDENSNLKNGIANLKKVNDKSVLPKKNVKRVKIDLKTNVDAIDIGAGISMGKATKNGGVIVECGSEKDLISIQDSE
ncbi:hypothetical protein WA026_019469 [Henosepilachna vigintioctopunctata]|uniref:Uncharacterized protein n=1 Tax=Henosepilachna vigintioctopunctata TaxID=420089 RepID=A0AAW1U4B8_9CUCU